MRPNGGGDPAPEPNSIASAAGVGTSLTMTEPAAEVPAADTSTTTGVATTGNSNDDGNELEVVMGHPGLQSPGHVSLSEVMSMAHFTLRQAQDVHQ
jgi:hypothetical protein